MRSIYNLQHTTESYVLIFIKY